MTKKLKIELADQDDIAGADYVACAPATDNQPLLLADNVMDFCCQCGCKVQLRPDVPPGPKRICSGCALGNMENDPEPHTVMVTRKSLEEAREYFRKHKKEK